MMGFGNQDTNVGASVQQTVTVRNTGTKIVTITSVDVTGPGAAHYVRATGTDNCGTGNSTGNGGTCQIRISFDPSSTGLQSATVTIHSNAPDVTITLSGTGTLTQLTAASPSVNFGSWGTLAGAPRGPTRSRTPERGRCRCRTFGSAAPGTGSRCSPSIPTTARRSRRSTPAINATCDSPTTRPWSV